MSIGFVAFSRMLSITYPELSKAVLRGRRNQLTVLGIWLYAGLMITPTALGAYGQFGYDEATCTIQSPQFL